MDDVSSEGWVRVVSEPAMNEAGSESSGRSTARTLSLFGAMFFSAGLGWALLLGCSREPDTKADAAEATQAASQAEAAPASKSAPVAGKPSYSEQPFDLSISVPGPVAVGKPAKAEVVLLAKGPYKVNQEYPLKIKLNEAPGLTFPNSVVHAHKNKDAVKLEAKKAVLSVAFTPKSAGEHALGGLLSFSVCTEERCLIEKRDLEAKVTAQ